MSAINWLILYLKRVPSPEFITMVFQLAYLSHAIHPMKDSDLDILLVKARARNQSSNITGLLVYSDQTFFQILEGPEDKIKALFARIKEDPRHTGVIELAQRVIPSAMFSQWSMGFIRENTFAEVPLPGYTDLLTSPKTDREYMLPADASVASLFNAFYNTYCDDHGAQSKLH
ncbi:BLUF domain-containing protein [Alteromonas sp. CYL-A6]|uniref:BLUF domain-containing protein n=1 Tax=Alteromonas nitratireducens TaxID=3390813 RepID=UPI0034C46134